MALSAGGNAPYAPPPAVIEVLTRYRERGLTTPITTEVVERAGVSQTLSRRTIQALRLLEFIDSEGMPTEQFETLSRAPQAEHKHLLGEHLTGVYAEVFAFSDPATDSYERVRDAFRGFDPKGQQERMVTLFLGLLEHAGLDTSAASSSRRRSDPASAKSKPKPVNGRTKSTRTTNSPGEMDKSEQSELPTVAESHGLPPGLLGLLQQIPRGGESWSQNRRETFLEAFTAVLDFSVPVNRNSMPATEQDEREVDA